MENNSEQQRLAASLQTIETIIIKGGQYAKWIGLGLVVIILILVVGSAFALKNLSTQKQ